MNFLKVIRRIKISIFKKRILKKQWLEGLPFTKNYSESDARLILSATYDRSFLSNYYIIFQQTVDDRFYEYHFLLKAIIKFKIFNQTILDVGSVSSLLPGILISFDNKVDIIDVREYPNKINGITVIKGDLLSVTLKENRYDLISCISTLEHVGLGRYGDEKNVDGDILAFQKLLKSLKANGLFVLTVPYGKPAVCFPGHRIYDKFRLNKIIGNNKIINQEFYAPLDGINFEPCEKSDTERIDVSSGYYGLTCLLIQKIDN